MNAPDAQDEAEMFDEETRGEDETVVEPPLPEDGHVHGTIVAPDQLLADDVAELIASEQPAEDPLTAEEAAMHYEDH
ncbi:MAG: hypothetical protein JJE46_11430 [Acidimicrobiia bacterium]|nr:hypothetical protein [Acidimicrobiia bacterium]